MTKQTDYWIKREQKNITSRKKSQAKLEKEIRVLYSGTMRDIEKEINDFLTRYSDKEVITMSEARRRVSNLDVEKFSNKAKDYVKNKDFSKKANEELRLYNLKMKVNRLELLKREIMLETLASSDSLERLMKRYLSDEALSEIKRQAGILGSNFKQIKRSVESVVNGSYKNATFSDRIWGLIQKDLQAELEKLLFRAMIQGKHPSKIAQELKKVFDVTVNQAQRLARTELARVQTEVQRKSYKDSGINTFVFIRELDACSICKSVSTDPIELRDFEVGINTAPIHPNCRCSTAPYFDREEFEKYLKNKNV